MPTATKGGGGGLIFLNVLIFLYLRLEGEEMLFSSEFWPFVIAPNASLAVLKTWRATTPNFLLIDVFFDERSYLEGAAVIGEIFALRRPRL